MNGGVSTSTSNNIINNKQYNIEITVTLYPTLSTLYFVFLLIPSTGRHSPTHSYTHQHTPTYIHTHTTLSQPITIMFLRIQLHPPPLRHLRMILPLPLLYLLLQVLLLLQLLQFPVVTIAIDYGHDHSETTTTSSYSTDTGDEGRNLRIKQSQRNDQQIPFICQLQEYELISLISRDDIDTDTDIDNDDEEAPNMMNDNSIRKEFFTCQPVQIRLQKIQQQNFEQNLPSSELLTNGLSSMIEQLWTSRTEHYTIHLSNDMIQQYKNQQLLLNNSTTTPGSSMQQRRHPKVYLSIPDGFIETSTGSVQIPDPSTIQMIVNEMDVIQLLKMIDPNRSLQMTPSSVSSIDAYNDKWWETKFIGHSVRLKLLPIRILTSNGIEEPSVSTSDLYHYLFVNTTSSLKWQFHKCSTGKLSIEPTEFGVLNVPIPLTASGQHYNTLTNAATTEALRMINERMFGTDSSNMDSYYQDLTDYVDLVMFITPYTPTNSDWIAYASVGGRSSVYHDKWGSYLGIQLHEIGHNFMLQHSQEGLTPYSDRTGAMGGAVVGYHDRMGFPLLCYNACNSWDLGWYQDRSYKIDTISTPNPQLVKIAAFVDYYKTKTSIEYVIVNVNDLYYMQFNRAKDYNSGTYDYHDNLVIIERLPTDTNLVTALNGYDNLQYVTSKTSMSLPSSGTLYIEICSWGVGSSTSPDYLLVSIGIGSSLCPDDENRRNRNRRRSIVEVVETSSSSVEEKQGERNYNSYYNTTTTMQQQQPSKKRINPKDYPFPQWSQIIGGEQKQ